MFLLRYHFSISWKCDRILFFKFFFPTSRHEVVYSQVSGSFSGFVTLLCYKLYSISFSTIHHSPRDKARKSQVGNGVHSPQSSQSKHRPKPKERCQSLIQPAISPQLLANAGQLNGNKGTCSGKTGCRLFEICSIFKQLQVHGDGRIHHIRVDQSPEMTNGRPVKPDV